MSNTTVFDPFLTTINLVQKNISLYGYSIIFLFGNIGCILNILVLTQREYRQNSCSCYILASTITNLIIINIVVFFRFLTSFNIDPTETSWFFCKFRAYIAQMTTVLSRTYIVLACIDRWAMTSTTVQRRAFARIKIPKILIPSVAIILCLSFIHLPLYQNIIKNRCVTTSDSYMKFYSIYNAILSGLLIPSLMLIFSILTIRNVKQLQKRANNNHHNIINKKNYDYQLLFMILVQQIVYIITNLPFVSYLLYIVFTMNSMKSNIQTAIDNLYMTVAYTLVHMNFSATFYMYSLTSQVFRKNLKRLLFHNRLMNNWFGTRQHSQTVAPHNAK